MLSHDTTNRIIAYLKLHLDPVFVYFSDDTKDSDGLLEISYISDCVPDMYKTFEMETALFRLAGVCVALVHLSGCDAETAGALISEGELIYCKDEAERIAYMHSFAKDFERARIRRRALLDRLKNCGAMLEQ